MDPISLPPQYSFGKSTVVADSFIKATAYQIGESPPLLSTFGYKKAALRSIFTINFSFFVASSTTKIPLALQGRVPDPRALLLLDTNGRVIVRHKNTGFTDRKPGTHLARFEYQSPAKFQDLS